MPSEARSSLSGRVSEACSERDVRLKVPAKTRWSSRIVLALKHLLLQRADGAVLLGLYAVGGPRGLDPVPALLHQRQAIATDAVVGAVGAVEVVAGSGVALAGS